MKIFEIYIHGHWSQVNWWIFRSWASGRRVNGIPFEGRVFYIGTSKVCKKIGK